jgi:hypothetical protein
MAAAPVAAIFVIVFLIRNLNFSLEPARPFAENRILLA